MPPKAGKATFERFTTEENYNNSKVMDIGEIYVDENEASQRLSTSLEHAISMVG